MCSIGARFLTDDALPIGNRDGRPVVHPSCACAASAPTTGRLTLPVNLSCVIVLREQQEGRK